MSGDGALQGPHLVCLDTTCPPCPIKVGSEVVGRLTLCPSEKRVSRNHFQLKLKKQPFGYQLHIIPLGANRMGVTKKGHTSSVSLIKNHPTVLLDGDVISVLPTKLDQHHFRVLLPNSQTPSQLAFFEPTPSPSVKKAPVVVIPDSSPQPSPKRNTEERATLDSLKRNRDPEVIVLDSNSSERSSRPPSKKRKVSSAVNSDDTVPSSATRTSAKEVVSEAVPEPSLESTMDLDVVPKKQQSEPSEHSQDTKLQNSIAKMEERLAEELKAAERTRAALAFLKKKRRSNTTTNSKTLSPSPSPAPLIAAPKSPPHRPSLLSQPSLPPSLPDSPRVSSPEESMEFPHPIAEVSHNDEAVRVDPMEVEEVQTSEGQAKAEVKRDISDMSAKAIQALKEDDLKKKEALREEQRLADEAFAKSLQPRECLICMDDKEFDHFHVLHGCGHNTNCRDCLLQMFKVAIESKSFPMRCPQCQAEIQNQDLEDILTKDLYTKYQKFALDSLMDKDPAHFSCCPSVNCEYMFFFDDGDDPDFQCELCHKRYCLNCKVDYHVSSTCEQYQQWCVENGMADEKFHEFIAGSHFKRCPGCKKWVEKTVGCDHISCTCGFEFCYKCGEKYPCNACRGIVARRRRR